MTQFDSGATDPVCGRFFSTGSVGGSGVRSRRIHFKEVVVRLRLLLLAAIGVIAVGQSPAVAADTNPQPIDQTHNVTGAPAPVDSAVFGTAPSVKTGTAICTTGTQTTHNVNTDGTEPES